MNNRRPNLFIIGAMKSGTTSLHSYFATHPQIFMSMPKEPEFFAKESVRSRGEEWYLSLFADSGDALVIGESSTAYTNAPQFPGVPERIAKFNPDARLIYVMRDPVERSISHYWYRVRFFGERRDMETAIHEDPLYTDVSNYAMQLKPYIGLFGRDQIATITFEALSQDPATQVKGLFRWLGVDSSFIPPNLSQRENVTPDEIPVLKNRRIDTFARLSFIKNLKRFISPAMVAGMNRIFGRYEYIRRMPVPSPDTVNFLRRIQGEQIPALTALLGREFPEWTTLNGA